MQVSEISVLFQLFILILLSGILPFCQPKRPPPTAQTGQVVLVKPKKKKSKSKEKKNKKRNKNKEDEEKEEESGKEFPEFVMPTESKKMIKLKEVEDDKKKKIKEGYFQEKSDQDDTLEKIESLRVEQSDRTKRAAKKKIGT